MSVHKKHNKILEVSIMGVTIAMANQKGGAGKTTASINVSAGLALKGCKVLLVDLDQQGHCSKGLGFNAADFSNTMKNLIDESIRATQDSNRGVNDDLDIDYNCYIVQTKEGFDYIPSNLDFAAAEPNLTTLTMQREFQIKKIIKPLKDKYDFIILDCPPALGNVSVNALVAADYVIIPTEASIFAFDGTSQLLHTIDTTKSLYNSTLKKLGVFVTRYKKNTIHADMIIESIKNYFGSTIPIFSSMGADTIKLSESNGYGMSVFQYCPGEKIVETYANLVEEILNGIESE